jgi:hypothetical protein
VRDKRCNADEIYTIIYSEVRGVGKWNGWWGDGYKTRSSIFLGLKFVLLVERVNPIC